MRKTKRWWIGAGVVGLVCMLVLIARWAALAPARESQTAFDAAQQQWQQHSVQHYTLRLDVGDPFTPCVHEVEVQAEQFFAVRATTCPAGKQVPQTVTALFADVERFVHVRYWVNGVGCDYLAPDMTYDPERGFPTHFRATQQPAPRWMPMLAGGCTMVAAQEPGWTVLHLEPLP